VLITTGRVDLRKVWGCRKGWSQSLDGSTDNQVGFSIEGMDPTMEQDVETSQKGDGRLP